MKIGVLIITRGDRPRFLEQAKKLIKSQTVQPNIVEIVDDKPLSKEVDITYRYRIGVERLKKKVDCIIFWEDDDFYCPTYIEKMMDAWIKNDKPDLLGLNNTVYYNIITNKYVHLRHNGRASMMSTMIRANAKIEWGKDNYAYTDMVLWNQLKGVSVDLGLINIGIKHGTGLCGGGGHKLDWASYNEMDVDKVFLSSNVDEDSYLFYAGFKYSISKRGNENPFLTIVTRQYKRPLGLSKNKESIDSLLSDKWEQIFIRDDYGYGMVEANRNFEYVKNDIKGDYVFLLDDDDFIVNNNMIKELEKIHKGHNPDVICFRMLINDHLFPLPSTWEKQPIAGAIGGSCMVVSKEVYQKFIHYFGVYPMGDYNFLKEIFKYDINVYWHDSIMSKTGRVSRGAKE